MLPLADQWPGREPQTGRTSFVIDGRAIPGHVAWNYSWILAEGIEGLVQRYQEALNRARDSEAKAFYEGVVLCWQAAIEWNRRRPGRGLSCVKNRSSFPRGSRMELQVALEFGRLGYGAS